jgi:hypothetical protein
VKTALAWPFLISRGRDTGYRTIVAPDFLCNLGRRGLLLEVAGGDIREGDVATYRAILGQGTNVGDLSVVYRTIPARGTDIDIEGDLLRDRQGRRIALVEGVVLRGRQPAVDVRSGDLERTHHAVIAAFRSFWQNERSFDVVPSTPLEISNRPLDLRLEPPYVLSDPAEQPYRSEPSKIRPQQPATANNQTQTHESTSTSPTTENEAQLLLYIQRLENELHHLKSRKPEPTFGHSLPSRGSTLVLPQGDLLLRGETNTLPSSLHSSWRSVWDSLCWQQCPEPANLLRTRPPTALYITRPPRSHSRDSRARGEQSPAERT